jgi:hypothetical protein
VSGRTPYDGRGAISTWRLELPAEFRPFEYQTITDAILTMRYSARDGGAALRDVAVRALRDRTADAAEDRADSRIGSELHANGCCPGCRRPGESGHG